MLDLDDLCSPLGEHGTSHGHQDVRSHLEHPHVSERGVHHPSLDFPGRTLALQVNARLNYRPARSAAPVTTNSTRWSSPYRRRSRPGAGARSLLRPTSHAPPPHWA